MEEVGEFAFLLGIDLVEVDFAFIDYREAVHDGCQSFAGSAPRGIEVDDAWSLVHSLPTLVRRVCRVVHDLGLEVRSG